MNGALTIARIRGIPIRAHFTLLIILPYIAFLMAARFELIAAQAGLEAGELVVPPLAWGLLLAVLLFACVLAHELGHSLVALAYGGRVSAITLMLLGGVSELHRLPAGSRAEGVVAAVGPLVSLLLGAAALGLYYTVPGPPDVLFGLFYLGQINLVVAVFNLLPAFPMDGGRVLRSLLATRLSRVRATRIAAGTGSAFAALFVVAGFFTGNFLLALIGLFVWSGARQEAAMVEEEQQLEGLSVRDVMTPMRTVIDGAEPAVRAVERMEEIHASALPVVEDDRLVGVVTAHHTQSLSREDLERTPTGAVAARDVPRLHADEPLNTALERMAEHNTEEAPVLEAGQLVGLLDASDLGRALKVREVTLRPARSVSGQQAPVLDRDAAEVVPLRPRRRPRSP